MKKCLALFVLVPTLACAADSRVKLNPTTGQVVAGVGAGRVSIDNLPVVSGGSPAWLNRTEIVYNGTDDGKVFHLFLYNTVSNVRTMLDLRGANEVAAGGGVWAAWGGSGLRTSTGFTCAKCGLLDVGHDGTLYYVPDREVGKGIVARYVDGREVVILSPTQTTALGARGADGSLAWSGYNLKGYSWNAPQPITSGEQIYTPSLVNVKGSWWYVYTTQSRLLAQPVGEPTGYVVSSTPNTYGADAIAWGNGLRVAYSTTQGAQPGRIVVLDLDLTKPRVKLTPTYVPPPQRLFTAYTGWFFSDSVRYGTDGAAPGSATVVVESALSPSRPTVIARFLIPEYRTKWDTVVGIYVSDEDGPLEQEAAGAKDAMAAAGLPPRPVISYTSRRTVPAKSVDYVGIEAYTARNETPKQAEEVWRALAKLTTKPVVIISGAYDRGFLTEDQVTETVYRGAEVARDTRAKMILWFAWGRPTGGKFHASVAQAAEAVARTAVVPSHITKPTVTITNYSPTSGPAPLKVRAVAALGGGPAQILRWRYRLHRTPAWTIAATNPASDLDHTFLFTKTGVYEIGVDVSGIGGSDGTGSLRIVTVLSAPRPTGSPVLSNK